MKKITNQNSRIRIKTKTKTKTKRRVNYKRSITRKERRINGGNALASGGYGCIFSPALKCANTTRETGKQQVSKLILTDYDELE